MVDRTGKHSTPTVTTHLYSTKTITDISQQFDESWQKNYILTTKIKFMCRNCDMHLPLSHTLIYTLVVTACGGGGGLQAFMEYTVN